MTPSRGEVIGVILAAGEGHSHPTPERAYTEADLARLQPSAA